MKENGKRTVVALPNEVHAKLKVVAAAKGVKMYELVDQLVEKEKKFLFRVINIA